ncbi:hypothetical protein DYB32_002700 [Aphanomyces invadans]|uniref:Condensation domain-containing protein n=1 Tax=Aphanomyces invadans TaxID=157072 RepID=A0A418B2L0_9STRA|nr:hypothetical protein DYB32_002700 [Aphanomyces invadans]
MTLHHPSPSPLSTPIIHSALAQLQARHPLLRTKVVPYDSSDNPFVLQVDHSLRIPFIELPSSASMAEQWARHRGAKLACSEPLIRILWQPQGMSTQVVFLLHHAIGDGRSLSCLAHDFLSILGAQAEGRSGLTLPPLALMQSCDDVAIRAVRSHPLRSLRSIAHTILCGIRGRRAFAFPIDAAAAETFATLKSNAPLGLTSQFDATTTAQLVGACKDHRVSVTAALGAALMHAVADMAATASWPTSKVSLGTVADARSLGSVDNSPVAREHLALFATALPVFSLLVQAKDAASESLRWSTAAAYAEHLNDCTQRQDGLVVGLLMGLNMKHMMQAPRLTMGRPTLILSNSGVLPKLQTEYGGVLKVSRVHVTSNQLYSFPKVSASTMGGVLTLNFDGVAPIIKPNDLAILQARTEWHLRAMAAS